MAGSRIKKALVSEREKPKKLLIQARTLLIVGIMPSSWLGVGYLNGSDIGHWSLVIGGVNGITNFLDYRVVGNYRVQCSNGYRGPDTKKSCF